MRIIWIEINGIINRTSTKFDEKIHKTQGALMLLVSAYTGNLDLIPPRSFGRDPPSIYCTLPSTMPAAGQSRRNNQNGGCDYRSQSELVGVEWLSLKPTKGKSIVRKLISKYELSRVEEYINTLHPSHFDALRARFFSGHFSNFKFERK